MSQIISINSQTWRIEEDGVRFFLLVGTERALLVDSGMQTRDAKEIAESLTDLPVELLNTHTDRDHTGSNDEFPYAYMSLSECANYRVPGKLSGKVRPVWDGDVLDLGERPLKIVALPGHTPGSIALLDVKYRALISGDPIQDGRVFMFGPQRDLCAYCHSLDRLMTMTDQFDEIYPSHGTFPVTKDILPGLRAGAEAILKGEGSYTVAELFGNKIRVYDAGVAKFLCPDED